MARENLQRVAGRLRILVLFALGLIVMAALVALLGGTVGHGLRVVTEVRGGSGPAAWIAATLCMALFALALWRLAEMLRRIAAGDRFSPAVTAPFRAFAFWLLLSALAGLLLGPLLVLLGLAPPLHSPGGAPVALRLDLRDLIFAVAALVLFLVARLLEDAARLAAELDEIV